MGEKQEKVWVVVRRLGGQSSSTPNKVFDDKSDARDYAKRARLRGKKYAYTVVGVKKG